MAQDFVGANNVNLLEPIGQHGSRLCGGSDAASARYIYTRLSRAAALLYRPEDAGVLESVVDEGVAVEPKFYVPVIPTVLLNGTVGIGTGFSTSVPSYQPSAVIENVRRLIAGAAPLPMAPWHRGFTGSVVLRGDRWWSLGTFVRKGPAAGEVLELPIGTWTEPYKEVLEGLVGGVLKAYENQSTDVRVRFVLRFQDAATLDGMMVDEPDGFSKLITTLKLASNKGLSTTNMHLYGPKGAIKKYATPEDVLREHHAVRLAAYAERKALMEELSEGELLLLSSKARFVREVISGDIALLGVKGAELEAVLDARGYARIEGGFEYLTRMPLSTLTAERASALEQDAELKGAALERLRGTTPGDLWMRELDELEAALAEDERKK